MGTLVCQHLAARRPELVRSLTLFGPILEPPGPARERLRERARLARHEGMVPVAEAVAASGLSTATQSDNPVVAAFVRENDLRQDPEGFAQSCEALAAAVAADLRLVRCPALLVTGAEDVVAPPGMAQRSPTGSRVPVCGCSSVVATGPHSSGPRSARGRWRSSCGRCRTDLGWPQL